MGTAAPHCIAFVNPKCANDAKQKKRVRIACVLNGKQKSAVYGAATHTSRGLHVARGDQIRQPQQSAGTTCSICTTDSPGGPLVLLWTVWVQPGTAFRGDQFKYGSFTYSIRPYFFFTATVEALE